MGKKIMLLFAWLQKIVFESVNFFILLFMEKDYCCTILYYFCVVVPQTLFGGSFVFQISSDKIAV